MFLGVFLTHSLKGPVLVYLVLRTSGDLAFGLVERPSIGMISFFAAKPNYSGVGSKSIIATGRAVFLHLSFHQSWVFFDRRF